MTLSLLLEKILTQAFVEAFPDLNVLSQKDGKKSKIIVTEASSAEFGHFQCNYALQIAKPLKMNPPLIAKYWVEKINELIPSNSEYQGIIEKIEIKGAGFINFYIHPEHLAYRLTKSIQDRSHRFGITKTDNPLKVIIDYSSPNTAKEMHVGHLRSTIIGDSLNRLFRFFGHDVLALNHVGDWGTQFGMLIAYIKSFVDNEKTTASEPLAFEYVLEKKIANATLSDLAQWYKASKKTFDADPEFKKQAQLEVVALQSGEPTSLTTWKEICEISRHAYQHVYKLLDIDPSLTERGESYYDPMLAKTIEKLEKVKLNGQPFVVISEGAKCIFLEGFTNREGEPLPLILQKSDGAYNYSSTDLAALDHRVNEEQGNCLLYVVDAGQSLHFQMIFKAAELAGFYDPKKVRIEHVPFGLVLRNDGKKFKTREGDTERLIDLIQNAIDKAKEILQNRNSDLDPHELQHTAEVLGINAIKYADLSCNRESDYIFSYEKMLKFEGNTAAFIMYAYVRIRSIQRKILQKTNAEDMNNAMEAMFKNEAATLKIIEPSEIALALLLCQFEDVLLKMQDHLNPSRLTEYLYRLAEKFHLFFHQCRVEGSEEQNSRLFLCYAVALVLKQGMELLGLRSLERM